MERDRLGNTDIMTPKLSCAGLFISAFGADFEEGRTVLTGVRSVAEVEQNVAAAEARPLPSSILDDLQKIADLVPFRPCEEPMGFVLNSSDYRGPGTLGR